MHNPPCTQTHHFNQELKKMTKTHVSPLHRPPQGLLFSIPPLHHKISWKFNTLERLKVKVFA